MNEDIGIDLGTTSILIFIKGKGIVLREPSIVAVDKRNNEVIAIGKEAKNMLGRVSNNIAVVKPLKDGVISESSKSVLESSNMFFVKIDISQKPN